ncbi:MAG: DoxX family protein [Myxococcaceae bacterium]|nr:DoxX family protein [Myxococcaceae bacterium]
MPAVAISSTPSSPSRALHVSLWVVQALLGAAFLMAGLTKTTQPMDLLAAQMPWTTVVGEGMTRFIGISEVLGALGLILPSLTRIKPKLTALAAVGLVTVMVLAMGFHLARGEVKALPINGVLTALAAFVAWGRFRAAPIAPRG